MTRSSAIGALACLTLAACSPQSPTGVSQLSADQTLRIAVPHDIGLVSPFDPDQISSPLDYAIGQNLFDGLFRMDDQLRVVPDLAKSMPTVSSDGRTYTVSLRDAIFSNGDPVTASDVLYSWNRAIIAGGPYESASAYASVFQPVAGFQPVEDALASGATPPALAGLQAPDEHTLVIKFSSPASDAFLVELTLPVAWVVDRRVIQLNGEQTWWQSAATLIGTGPFKMVSRVPGTSMSLVPVPHWWGGPTGQLKKVVLDVVPDAEAVAAGYHDGRLDVVGLADYGPNAQGYVLAAALAIDPAHAREVHRFTYGRTEWIGFNTLSGPFGGANGLMGRLALSQAVDRTLLAQAVCRNGMLCEPATGGLISKGLTGYLGDGTDHQLRFDPVAARAALDAWDPTRTLRTKLTYVYIANSMFRDVADDLRAQWRRNLGIDVKLQGYDTHTFLYDRVFGDYSLFRGSWGADYNSPQDWYDNLFLGSGPSSGSGYNSPQFVATVSAADGASGTKAISEYQQADRTLLDQAVIDPLFYYVHTVVVKPYVLGFGANAMYDYRWTELKILQH